MARVKLAEAGQYRSLSEAQRAALSGLLTSGTRVASVRDPTSIASGFGTKDRPSIELLASTFRIAGPSHCVADSRTLPTNVAYCVGLLAWTLRGDSDVQPLSYYRRGAGDLSDDGYSLSGAFGSRLFGYNRSADQIEAIAKRVIADPSSRRTTAMVLTPADNFRSSREYPCAVGIQLFARGPRLHWLTMMRAQQALTVLPYDGFLFMMLHLLTAARLELEAGTYMHSSGTLHVYKAERALAKSLVTEAPHPGPKLTVEPVGEAVAEYVRELCEVEEAIRTGRTGPPERSERSLNRGTHDLLEWSGSVLGDFSRRKQLDDTTAGRS